MFQLSDVLKCTSNQALLMYKCYAKRGSKSPFCQFDDFVAHYNKLKYQGDVNAACMKPYSP